MRQIEPWRKISRPGAERRWRTEFNKTRSGEKTWIGSDVLRAFFVDLGHPIELFFNVIIGAIYPLPTILTAFHSLVLHKNKTAMVLVVVNKIDAESFLYRSSIGRVHV
ncbi:hypothetical protein FRAAL6327 [Frankia alni ACN14a]|uniref:Uncharacterized protein n=1 Tax=Frankia alni (strain DSM 45986 / CECT 9034 / ACN14a) TaxID=326424 RepID=Q0RC77_FRAAA|nr:hypothetical protein FRAAL6327 [Frankia alni ACN14a]